MIKIQGPPKSSALFFWTDNTSDKGKIYYASFFTISPVEMDIQDLHFQDESVNFSFPIMVHEPLPCSNIEKIISDARERNAAIVDCGRTTVKSIRARMKKALGEYLQALIAHLVQLQEKQKDMASKNVVDVDFENIKKKLKRASSQERLKKFLEAVDKIREDLVNKDSGEVIEKDLISLNKYRLETEADFESFMQAADRKGKIADRIVSLYKERLIKENESSSQTEVFEFEEELSSLFILNRLDILREEMRKKLAKTNEAIAIVEDIYRIKYLNPPFCSDDDLNKFCAILTEKGTIPGNISKKYIDKYFMVITRNFAEAAKIHKQIQEAEKSYFSAKEKGE